MTPGTKSENSTRAELAGLLMWSVLVLLAGVVVGRFALPPWEPQHNYFIELVEDRNIPECTLSIHDETTFMGRTKREEVPGIKCGERRHFGRSWLQCRCVP